MSLAGLAWLCGLHLHKVLPKPHFKLTWPQVAGLMPCLYAGHERVQRVTFKVVLYNKDQDYAVLHCPVERRPLKIRKVRADDIHFSSDLRLASFTFDLTIQACNEQGESHVAPEEAIPHPGDFELSLFEVGQISADHS